MQKNNSKNITQNKTPKNKASKRFHILFTEEEWEILQNESKKREMSISELIRKAIFSEIKKVNTLEKIQALQNLTRMIS